MTDDQIEALILKEIKKRKITWSDMVYGRSISYEKGPERLFRINRFKAESWSDRMIELICDGDYNPFDKHIVIRVPVQDLIRFWWNRIICQDDMMDEILEDIFIYFKDRLNPKPDKKPEPGYDVDFSQLIPEQQRAAMPFDYDIKKAIKRGRFNE